MLVQTELNASESAAIVQLAQTTWLQKSLESISDLNGLIKSIYEREMILSSFSKARLNLLEFCQYLERCLIPALSGSNQSVELFLSICAMINTKFEVNTLTGSTAWSLFSAKSIQTLFTGILSIFFTSSLKTNEQMVALIFIGHCVNSIEVDVVRKQVQRILGLCIWLNLSEKRRLHELTKSGNPRKMMKLYSVAVRLYSQDGRFIANLLRSCLDSLDSRYINNVLKFVIECESQLPTRRFLDAILDEMNFVVNCKRNPLIKNNTLVNQLEHLINTDLINNIDGERLHYEKLSYLQRILFKLCRHLTVSEPTCPLIQYAKDVPNLHDYLYRNFVLFKHDSNYAIREDLEDVISRMNPVSCQRSGRCLFNGWSRMALPIQSFTIIQVSAPNVGEDCPSNVCADVELLLDLREDIRSEWEALRKYDVCFLLSLNGRTDGEVKDNFRDQFGVQWVRGCEVEGILDASGKLVEETVFLDSNIDRSTNKRTYRVKLDANQYRLDGFNEHTSDVYSSFNVIVRRNPKENNFKSVLETIRSLMNANSTLPSWLHDLLLGYGQPNSAHYSQLVDSNNDWCDWNDTFLDGNHIVDVFDGDHEVEFIGTTKENAKPPFCLKFEGAIRESNEGKPMTRLVPECCPVNQIRFTRKQVDAILSTTAPRGLTMVVGPPGTGKTDLAVQIIANIYKNEPNQRTLIITHSNQALNQLFEKIIRVGVQERHLLRLGHGERNLESDFSRFGRVDYILERRLRLLEEVSQLARGLGVEGDVGYTCETAGYFFLHHIRSRWDRFKMDVRRPQDVRSLFPFHTYFGQLNFKGKSIEEDMHVADQCFYYLKSSIFDELADYFAFEQMRSGVERAKFLLVKHAKVIAMTCTHAALRREYLLSVGFKYDNILMEESAQILEIETFIPLLLQKPDIGHFRLKRWIMIGDHNQLPPVIRNQDIQKQCNMEQSLFARFVRLGVPVVQLDAQGRSRPSIAQLFSWRYEALANMDHTYKMDQWANPGFLYDYQLIDVPDNPKLGRGFSFLTSKMI
ncbi:hypothetical protein ACOME3_008020 [Neoechinorhynchus agilis]